MNVVSCQKEKKKEAFIFKKKVKIRDKVSIRLIKSSFRQVHTVNVLLLIPISFTSNLLVNQKKKTCFTYGFIVLNTVNHPISNFDYWFNLFKKAKTLKNTIK